MFGSVAGISPASLNKIVSKVAAPYDGLVEVCDLWLKKCAMDQTPPTWRAVAEIVSLIGNDVMADALLKVYTTGKSKEAKNTFIEMHTVAISHF